MFIQSRKILAIGTAVTVATASVAIAGTTGADLNDAKVVAKTTPSKLSKKKFTPVNSLLGVVNSPDSAGNEDANAKSERIAISKNIKVKLNKAPVCTAALPNGSTPQFAKDACPKKSYLGSGEATVHAPGPVLLAAEPTVSVFNGPDPGQLRLHTYSSDLGPASPVVNAFIVNATQQEKNKGYGQALSVPNAPVDRRAQDHVVQRDGQEVDQGRDGEVQAEDVEGAPHGGLHGRLVRDGQQVAEVQGEEVGRTFLA